MDEYRRIMRVVEAGTLEDLQALAATVPGFPDAGDPFIGRRWIINAIDTGSTMAIRWTLTKGVDLNFRDEEGVTPRHLNKARAVQYLENETHE